MSFSISLLILLALVKNVTCLPYYQTFKGEDGDLRLRNATVYVKEQPGGHQYVWKIGGRVQYYDGNVGWGYICTNGPPGQNWDTSPGFVVCHQLNMKYFAALSDGQYGEKEADAQYSISTMNCGQAGTNRGPNSLVECTLTGNGNCAAGDSPPAGIECTLPFSESMACYNGGSPVAAESGSGDTSDTLQLYIYCQCPQEFTGNMCEIKLTPTCHNGGTPERRPDGTYFCVCNDRYSGPYCESDLMFICQNGGTSDFSSGSWTCFCSDQFTGKYCETDLKPICHNGGTSLLSGQNWSCACTSEFTGTFCETDLKPICHNGGTSLLSGQNWSCTCSSEFTGTFCETGLKPVCQNGGTAEFGTEWKCVCQDQFSGDYCEKDVKPVCQNSGTAQFSGGQWKCICSHQFSGIYCENDVKPVCQNSGTAHFSGGQWKCICSHQFSGIYCENDIVPLCLNGGTAQYSSNKWICTCLPDFSGTHCETDLKSRLLGSGGNGTVSFLQCLNGGIIDIETRGCKCKRGFTGNYCETDPKQGSKSNATSLLIPWVIVLSIVLLIVVSIIIYICIKFKNQKNRRVRPGSSSSANTDSDILALSKFKNRTAEVKPFKYTEVVTTNKTHDLRMGLLKTVNVDESDMRLEDLDELDDIESGKQKQGDDIY